MACPRGGPFAHTNGSSPNSQTLVRSRFADEPDALAAVNFGETKRIATGQLIAALRANEQKYQTVAIDALLALGEVDTDFPHLARITDGPKRVSEARAAHKAVRYVIDHSELAASRRSARLEAEKRAVTESVRRLHESKLSQLREEFFTMHQIIRRTPEARKRFREIPQPAVRALGSEPESGLLNRA